MVKIKGMKKLKVVDDIKRGVYKTCMKWTQTGLFGDRNGIWNLPSAEHHMKIE